MQCCFRGMEISGVREYLGDDWKAVQDLLGSALHSGIELLDTTNENLLAHSGKQLRPLLSLLVSRACLKSAGESEKLTEVSWRYAAAAEQRGLAPKVGDVLRLKNAGC